MPGARPAEGTSKGSLRDAIFACGILGPCSRCSYGTPDECKVQGRSLFVSIYGVPERTSPSWHGCRVEAAAIYGVPVRSLVGAQMEVKGG